MNTTAGDGRFEIIAKAKEDLIRSTNIETSEDEMKVLDSFLFRCWRMGWLDRYETTGLNGKAILVFDKMPNSCDECEVRCGGYTAKDYAQKGIKRPSWCPLKPLPQKHTSVIENSYAEGRKDGWNACIEELEKCG